MLAWSLTVSGLVRSESDIDYIVKFEVLLRTVEVVKQTGTEFIFNIIFESYVKSRVITDEKISRYM